LKQIVVTGGSRGIGAAIVRRFAQAGHMVAFTYRTGEKEAEALCAETGAVRVPCDVRDEQSVQRAAERVLSLFHRPDALINNAGAAQQGLVETMSLTEWNDQLAVHMTGAFLWSRALLPVLRGHGGSIVNVASIWGLTGASYEAAYSAAKAGLIGLTRALAREEAPAVRVNAVAPGVIRTGMLDCYTPDDLKALQAEIPLDRLGTPEDVAAAVYFLTSEDAAYITGQVLEVNGGMHI